MSDQFVVMTGSREWELADPVKEAVSSLNKEVIVLHGGARGLDTLAHNFCLELGLKVIPIFADWYKYGKTAGVIRNTTLIEFNPILVIGFLIDNIPCNGTQDCLAKARLKNIPTLVCHTVYNAATFAWE